MDGAMSGILTVLDAATSSTNNYRTDFDGIMEELNGTPDHTTMHALIGGLVTTTAEIEKKNEELSASLNSS